MGTADRAVGHAGTLGLFGLLAAAVWAWPRLPSSVPIHFSFSGQPDGWGPRYLLLLLPAFGVTLYWLLTAVAHHPDLYTHANTTAATPEGQVRQYVLGRQFLLALRAFVVLLFVGDVVLATYVATGRLQELGAWVIPAQLVSLVILVVSYIWAILRVR